MPARSGLHGLPGLPREAALSLACGTVAAMAGNQSRYEWQFKQRLTSGGLNLQTSYLARNTSELGRYGLGGTDQEIALQTGIIRGFVPAVVAATLKISVGPGLGHFYDSGVSEPDSKAKWMELRTAKEVTATPGDAANPRWDVVEIQPATIDGTAEIIDFFNPGDNTFSPAVVSVQKISEVSIQVRAGTPNANPKLPAGTAGWCPICYVYVAANALALDGNRVMFCRPILTLRRGTTPDNVTGLLSQFGENINISGGGWAVETEGLDGTLANAMTGTFPNWGRPFYMGAGTAISINASGNYVGGGLPLVSTPVYAYVAPPPYPSGYDVSLAPRELFITDTTTPNVAATIPAGSRGCIVVVASGGPNTNNPLGQRGSPNAVHSFVDNLWGNFDLLRSDMLYIGSGYYDTTLPGLVKHRVVGSHVGSDRKAGNNFNALFPIVAPTNVSVLLNIAGDPSYSLPKTALYVRLTSYHNMADDSDIVMVFSDTFAASDTEPRLYHAIRRNGGNGESNIRGINTWIHLDTSGNVVIASAAKYNVGNTNRLYVWEWEDAVLALR